MKKILILGMGASGCSAARFLQKRNIPFLCVDRKFGKSNISNEISDETPIDFNEIEKVVISPGVSSSHPHCCEAIKARVEVIGEVELALKYVKNRCLAITGSNGKTTTTLLVEHALNHVGRAAKAVGNVGYPLTAAVDELPEDTILVSELSSWQLETMATKVLDAGVCLNITPNHLDRHKTMEDYAQAKWNLQNCLKDKAPFYVQEKCFREFGHLLAKNPLLFGWNKECSIYCDGESIYENQKKAFTLPEKYRAGHDVENIMGAYALCRTVGINETAFVEALQTFKKPPHRIEYICKLNEISFYDDSKATSLDAVEKAIFSMKGPTYLIAGGVHKGAPYTPWIKAFDGKVKRVFSLGEAACKIKEDLEPIIDVEIVFSLEEAVKKAFHLAKGGENILLSPGCSSFDMFKDYAQRGDEFKRIVQSL